MSDTFAVRDALRGIASRLEGDADERDVERAFRDEEFYALLGYESGNRGLRDWRTIPDEARPDCVTRDDAGSVTAVYEFESTGETLSSDQARLLDSVDRFEADYGVSTNGEEISVHRPDDRSPHLTVSLVDATADDAAALEAALEKPRWDVTDPRCVAEFLDRLDEAELDGERGRERFVETFRLETDGPFAALVTAMMDLLAELWDDRDAAAVAGAHDFWNARHASAPAEPPDGWKPFVDGDDSLQDFAFCLESGHALLARLLLSKAAVDHGCLPADEGLRRRFEALSGVDGAVALDAYPVAATETTEAMRRQFGRDPFEDDVFGWWREGYGGRVGTGREESDDWVRDVAGVSPSTRERFGRAVARVALAVLRFDLSRVEGDPLGDLYQRHLDSETRKVLGEFYTPQPIVDYILDGVGYDAGVSAERLVDPACGSGTFLVEAVNRYLDDVRRDHDDPDWAAHLDDLCTRPGVVGFDVDPFAVFVARIRFVVAVLPEYREAKRSDATFTLGRLPVFRTDALLDERKLAGTDHGGDGRTRETFDPVSGERRDVTIPVRLPVEGEGGPLVRRVRMPAYETAAANAGVRDGGDYFTALRRVLDAVRAHAGNGTREDGDSPEARRHRDDVPASFVPYVEDLLSTLRRLPETGGEEGPFEAFEEAVLAHVAKNALTYDYVVGNPPYVRIQRLPAAQRSEIERLYRTGDGGYDLYYLFYERGIDLLEEGGNLGYITPNQFMRAEDGAELREVIRSRTNVREVFDFRGTDVFEGVVAYPAILLLEAGEGSENDVRCVRVRAEYEEPPDDLVERVVESAAEHRAETEYADANVDVFRFSQAELTADDWTLMPPAEYEVFRKLDRRADARVESITDAVFQGLRTGANDVFVVEPSDADRIAPDDGGRTVVVRPSGSTRTFEVESDLLCPWLEGNSFRRWHADWRGEHLLVPYDSDHELLSHDVLAEEYPLTWTYLNAHRETLEARDGGALRGADDWYRFSRPQNLARFPEPKLIGKEFSDAGRFAADEGTWHFASGYGLALTDAYRSEADAVAGFLNSAVADFYLKHVASIKSFSPVEAYYAYRTRYLDRIPFRPGETEEIEARVSRIGAALEAEARVRRFPAAYVGDFDGDLGHVDYEWQTRRYPVDAEIRRTADGRLAVTAGRTDEITDVLIERGNSAEAALRAAYVHAAVDGRNVTRGEEQTIPIPLSREGVERLVAALAADRRRVAETDVERLESEIDRAVYDRFDLSEEDRTVIEAFLEVF